MSKILFINSSPIANDASFSYQIAKAFETEYAKLNPSDSIEWLDLNEEEKASDTLTSKNFSEYFKNENVDPLIEQIKNVDKLVIVAPMTNFNYPATLKNWIDKVFVANKTFSYKYSKKGGSVGLMDHLKVMIINTQGAPEGWYAFGDVSAMLKGAFEFIGAKVDFIKVCGTKVDYINKEPKTILDPNLELIKEKARNF
ncbi:FMN-dependent NADH-azoreductase [Mycoplasma bradburyae]|uniref:FMN dependent NADH:quinone oxidoreductase n=1 Tax=Mycoplasma bradburyae TaxID=2963128 RepID=A0ABT5GAF9_9MOLU|nr:FMN-dependent NADH-azoreductase [Mycoplasma bradburyae]MDC4181672.1 FMN-dependent NADH-azoreductase [Mycoplasma bradburyae]UTS69906.1 FMN-dependent NADH-azoreductase [Mycoplasma bradburyae]